MYPQPRLASGKLRTCACVRAGALAWPICTAASKLTLQALDVALSAGTRHPSAWVCRADDCSREDYQLLRKLHGAGRGPDPLYHSGSSPVTGCLPGWEGG